MSSKDKEPKSRVSIKKRLARRLIGWLKTVLKVTGRGVWWTLKEVLVAVIRITVYFVLPALAILHILGVITLPVWFHPL